MKRNRRLSAEGAGIVRKALAAAVCLSMLIVSFVPLTAAAEGVSEMPDLNRKGSLSITFTYEGEPISDGNKVGIFKVADVVEDNGYKFVWREGFADVGAMPENLDEENAALSSKLVKIALDKKLTLFQNSKELDEKGNVTFSDLPVGLYLVVQTKRTETTLSDKSKVKYTINPFLITIPQNKDGKLVYDIATNPKVSPEKDTTPPPKKPSPTPPKPRRLPQTGQLWWPVMVLGAAGFLFVCVGLIRKNRAE